MSQSLVNLFVSPATTQSDEKGTIRALAKTFQAAGLQTYPHAAGLNIYGDLHTILNAVKSAVTAMHDAGVDRIYTHMQIESRRSGVHTIDEKLRRVREPA